MAFGLLIAAEAIAIDRDANGRYGALSVCLVVVWCCVRLFGIVLWDFAGFPECFSALSSGRTTARAATNVHEKDLSHTQLRVSAPLNSPLRSQVARFAMRRLFLPVFSIPPITNGIAKWPPFPANLDHRGPMHETLAGLRKSDGTSHLPNSPPPVPVH